MRYLGLGLLCGLVLVGIGCSLFQQRVVAVDEEGYLLKSDGSRAMDENGKPIKAPEGSMTSLGALLAVGGTVMAMRTAGGLASRLPPPWGFIASFFLGGTGVAEKKKA